MNGGVSVIGAGLAGSECAWQIVRRGVPVTLYEMRPAESTPAHETGCFAELVCSNSLGSDSLENAAGLLKAELRFLGSLIMQAADRCRLPAGSALAVDRSAFSTWITEKLSEHRLVRVVSARVDRLLSDRPVVIATGPLTAHALAEAIQAATARDALHFFDAAAPVVTAESLDLERLFWGSRYGKGGGADYLNAAMGAREYRRFRDALCEAECQEVHGFEDSRTLFEGCLPIEELARRGADTLRYGPLKPVGLSDPRTGRRPFAVVQLRRDDAAGSLLNLVGFQTRLRFSEQRRILAMIPGLEQVSIARYGVMHRNTYIESPQLLFPTLQFRQDRGVFFAGQIVGSEGYVESAAGGWLAGLNAARLILGLDPIAFPSETAIGALFRYVTSPPVCRFQPMNANFGLLPPIDDAPRDRRVRNRMISQRALDALRSFASKHGLADGRGE